MLPAFAGWVPDCRPRLSGIFEPVAAIAVSNNGRGQQNEAAHGVARNRAVAALVLSAGAAWRLHPAGHGHPTTVDIQGAGEWKRAPQMRAFYDETVATFANGAAIDIDAYEARSFAIFRDSARANGADEEGMIDHLKLIPRQVVDIVKEDQAVLRDYDSFSVALSGPD